MISGKSGLCAVLICVVFGVDLTVGRVPTCPSDYFGKGCAFHCRCPVNDTCDRISGQCSSNVCLYGWAGASCQQKLPVLSDPPDVLSIALTQITVAWDQWISNQTGLGEGLVIQYVLQQVDNVTNTWQDATAVNASSSAPSKFTHTVVNLEPNMAYKYRVQLIIDDNKKPYPSIPGPESTDWIHPEIPEIDDVL